MATTTVPWRPVRSSFAGVALAVVLAIQAVIGFIAASEPRLAMVATALLIGAVAAAISPVTVAAIAFPSVMATWRLGGGGVDLSYADAVLVISTVLALPFVPWRSPALRGMLAALGVYLVILAIAIMGNPSSRAVIELFHRLELVGGSIIVGAAVAASHKTHVALRLLIGAAAVLAGGAIAYTVSHGFEPAYPFGIHKNAAGFFLTSALLLLVIAPKHIRLPPVAVLVLQALLVLGLVACQSRASAATFVGVLFLATLRGGSKALLPVVGTVAVAAMIWTTSQDVTDRSHNAKFNSVNTRLDQYEGTYELWTENPVFGVGVRFWRDPEFAGISEPHNLFISSLGESGVVGTAGFVAFNIIVLAKLRRRKDSLGRAAFYLTVAHAIDAMAGIFWVAGTGTLPWLVVGLAVGSDLSAEDDDGAAEPDSSGSSAALAGERSGSVVRR